MRHFKKTIPKLLKVLVIYYLIAVALVLVATIGFYAWAGNPPACGVNRDVGPCGFWPFMGWILPGILVYALPFPIVGWLIWLLIGLSQKGFNYYDKPTAKRRRS